MKNVGSFTLTGTEVTAILEAHVRKLSPVPLPALNGTLAILGSTDGSWLSALASVTFEYEQEVDVEVTESVKPVTDLGPAFKDDGTLKPGMAEKIFGAPAADTKSVEKVRPAAPNAPVKATVKTTLTRTRKTK